MTFEQWADETFGSRFIDEETLTYFRMSAAWEAAVMAEREACAKVCEEHSKSKPITDSGLGVRGIVGKHFAAAIRNRGDTK